MTFEEEVIYQLRRIATALEQQVLEAMDAPAPVGFTQRQDDPLGDLPPIGAAPDEYRAPTGPLPVIPRPATIACPVHGVAWSLKPAGTSAKTGKPYAAFWKCDAKNADGSWCQQKPALVAA